jgi:hypothetical protein
MNSTCCICGLTFEARNSYGICTSCFSRDRLREYDRVESAARQAHREHIVPITLTLVEWLSVLSDFAGVCALCKRYGASKILMFDRTKGLIYTNVLPACYACEHHWTNGFEAAREAVRLYLDAQTLPRFITPNPTEEEEKQPHVEYH